MSLMPVVVMGVSGSGKTTVGQLIARQLEMPFIDGDDLHSLENKRKMAAGIPLQDSDRIPWLRALADVLAREPVVLACSALRRSYRDVLRQTAPNLRLVYLYGTSALLLGRLIARPHEFMPPSMLESQVRTLEPPQADELALTVDVELPLSEIVESIVSWIGTSDEDTSR